MNGIVKNKLLTIAIPTFNRNQIIFENLCCLLPQMQHWAEILIIDNSSNIPVADGISELLKEYSSANVRIIRNEINIGGNSNILRCIENSCAKYLWILGDDDFPANDALDKIYNVIKNFDVVWALFYSDDSYQPIRNNSIEQFNLNEFLGSLKSVGELVFMSVNVYRTDCIKSGLDFGYDYQSNMAPHLISMIEGIRRSTCEGKYCIRHETLFKSISNNKDRATSWHLYKAFVGIMSMYQIPFDSTISKQLIRLVRGSRKYWLTNKEMIRGFSYLSKDNGVKKSLLLTINFPVILFINDRLKSILSIPMYFGSIIFGKLYIYAYRLVKNSTYL